MESDIEKIAQLIDLQKYTDAIMEIKNKYLQFINNYQVYFMLGVCYENIGEYEKAFYSYKYSAFQCKGTMAYKSLIQAMNQVTLYGLDGYKKGKALEELIYYRICKNEFEYTYEFLNEQLYDTTTADSLKDILTEENMLYYMMLEIVLCEKKYMACSDYNENNTIKKFNYDIFKFKEIYTKIKFIARRCWFGFEDEKIACIDNIINEYRVSAHMLAIIIKYVVNQKYWIYVYNRVIYILNKNYENDKIVSMLQKYVLMCSKIECKYISENTIIPSIYHYNSIKLDYNSISEVSENMIKDNDISIIFCTNDSLYANECVEYINRLKLPEGMKVNIIEVWNAPGMAAGYNCAMRYSNAKYKFYIHHDTFIIDENAIIKTIEVFQNNRDVGLMGILGAINLTKNFLWWHVKKEDLRMKLYQEAVLDTIYSYSSDESNDVEDCEGLDGIFLATSYDYLWQEDIFDNWHFYDIAQCFEFRKHSKRTVFVNDKGMWVLHETTQRKDPKKMYEKYFEIFCNYYLSIKE